MMSKPEDSAAGPQANEPHRPRGRYRFQAGRPLNPDAGVHPEMVCGQDAAAVGAGIPNSPQELIAMQDNNSERPQKPEYTTAPKVQEVLDLIAKLDNTAADDLQVALALVRRLENYHDSVVDDLREDEEVKHSQIIRWAVDADRLYRARLLLESVDLE